MKIENLKLLSFGEKTKNGRYFVSSDFSFSPDKEYLGYLNFESSCKEFKDACAFMIEKLRIEDNILVGDFNLINAPANELMSWIGEFEIFATTLGVENEDGMVTNAELVSFVAEPTVELTKIN